MWIIALDLENLVIKRLDKNAGLTSSTINYKEGDYLKLLAQVKTKNVADNVTFSWYQKTSSAVYPVLTSNEAELDIFNLQGSNSGIYFCVVKVLKSILKSKDIKVEVDCKCIVDSFMLVVMIFKNKQSTIQTTKVSATPNICTE